MNFRSFMESEYDFYRNIENFDLDTFGVMLDMHEERGDIPPQDLEWLRFFYFNKIYPLQKDNNYYWTNESADVLLNDKALSSHNIDLRDNGKHPWDLPGKIIKYIADYNKNYYSTWNIRDAFQILIRYLRRNPQDVKLILKNYNKKDQKEIAKSIDYQVSSIISRYLHPYYFPLNPEKEEETRRAAFSLVNIVRSKFFPLVKPLLQKKMSYFLRLNETKEKTKDQSIIKAIDTFLNAIQS